MDPSGRSDLLDDLAWRGMIADATDLGALGAAMAAGPVTLYCGFDPTAPSLHFGNLVQLVTLRRFQEAGHRVFAVVGGATGLVGDPAGKAEERVLNPAEVVSGWVDRIRGQVEGVLRFDGDNPARIVDNLEWTGPMPVLAFLRDVGKHFTISRMLAKEVVATRLEAGISYTEFSYQILQANDFLELYRRQGVTLQTGGSDQWGNLTAGVDLIRRVEGAEVHALATPLITKADGTKYGKTAAGSVWMDAAMTSPYAFYQYFLNQADADVGALLRAFSFRSRGTRSRRSSTTSPTTPSGARRSTPSPRSSPPSSTGRRPRGPPSPPARRSSAPATCASWTRRPWRQRWRTCRLRRPATRSRR